MSMTFTQRIYDLRRQLVLLTILIALLGALLYVFPYKESTPTQVEDTRSLSDLIRMGEAPIPALTEATKAKLEKSTGFAALVSYTESGFEPNLVSIKKGEAVRFTNNSSNDLWISSNGEKVAVYPRTKEGCGSSDLDSCEPFDPQDFWEFTFDTKGTWEVTNNLDRGRGGFVRVE